MIIGKVTGREVATTRDSDNPVLLLQVELTHPRDIDNAELLMSAGEDVSPHDDDYVLVLSLSKAFRVAIGVDDGIDPAVGKGEKEIYSYSKHGGDKLARTLWNAAGEVIHNGGSRLVARKDDETTSNIVIDFEFWTWIAAVGTALGITPPTTFTGKVNNGTDEVKVP